MSRSLSCLGWNGCAQRVGRGVITCRQEANGQRSVPAGEPCWCVRRETARGPTAEGRSESPILWNGGWGESQPGSRPLQQHGESASDRRVRSPIYRSSAKAPASLQQLDEDMQERLQLPRCLNGPYAGRQCISGHGTASSSWRVVLWRTGRVPAVPAPSRPFPTTAPTGQSPRARRPSR
jgi:hypothetical protein